ncbi:4-oxalocrotonate tautomerase family protein [Brevibacterium permense]|uniref:2-hydroxymuconate tautomerase n=1 Tax=Brevibacterium permense TaxID=234834 RepID=UPI0021D3E943|nr:2-hydroxymuconate tautomerase [Brevibacterium permense]MCU4296449.1 4-oxalocrotonate tautomerase family protein [Brevibacterium permense]
MPLIDISIARGRTPEQLRALIAGVHEAAASTTGAADENITVIVREVEKDLWSRTNTTIAERESGVSGAQASAG